MKNLEWIRDLVESERRMEETGMIDLATIPDETRDLQLKTNEFLRSIKEEFDDDTAAFNNLKNTTVGSVKIYGISNTIADFMLFRNGYKLLFAATARLTASRGRSAAARSRFAAGVGAARPGECPTSSERRNRLRQRRSSAQPTRRPSRS